MLSCSKSFKVLVYLWNFPSDFCSKGAKLSEVKLATSIKISFLSVNFFKVFTKASKWNFFFSFFQLFEFFTKAYWRWMDGCCIEIICSFVSIGTNGTSILFFEKHNKYERKYTFIFEQKHSLLIHLWILELISTPCLLSDFCKIWWRPNRKVRE